MKILKRIGLVICIAVPSTSFAADWYIGLGIGQSYIDQPIFGETGNGFKIFGGANLNQYFALEASYVDIGYPTEDFFGLQTEYTGSQLNGWAKGILPVSKKFDLFAKVGIVNWSLDKTTTSFGLPSQTTSSSGTDLGWGLGAAYNFSNMWSAQLEYEGANVGDGSATFWSISGVYHF
jgi:opacity protein-like surface antigen